MVHTEISLKTFVKIWEKFESAFKNSRSD